MARALFDVSDVVNDVLVLVLVADVAESHFQTAGAAAYSVAMRDPVNALAKSPPAFRTPNVHFQASHRIAHGAPVS